MFTDEILKDDYFAYDVFVPSATIFLQENKNVKIVIAHGCKATLISISFDFEALDNVRQTKEYVVNHDQKSIVFNGQSSPRDLLER